MVRYDKWGRPIRDDEDYIPQPKYTSKRKKIMENQMKRISPYLREGDEWINEYYQMGLTLADKYQGKENIPKYEVEKIVKKFIIKLRKKYPEMSKEKGTKMEKYLIKSIYSKYRFARLEKISTQRKLTSKEMKELEKIGQTFKELNYDLDGMKAW